MIHSLFSFRSLLYLVYAVILTAVFLYVRFPAEKFKAYCERNVQQVLPGSACKIERIGYRFPMSAAFESIKITRDIDGVDVEMVVDRLAITPEPFQFWKVLSFRGEMYGGQFEGDLQIDRKTQSFQLTGIDFQGLEVGDFGKSIGLAENSISGKFFFSGGYRASITTPADGEGKGVVQVLNGSMSLLQPILALSAIDFEKIGVDVTRKNGTITFENGELVGADITADFTGELRLVSPLSNSNILLSGHLQPDEVYMNDHPKEQQLVQRLLQRYKVTVLPFKVGGTVKRPLFRFSK